MSNLLQLAPGLSLDADYIGGGTVALLAKKGAGKTYTGRVMAEEFWRAKVPFVALDPMDAWWGLRSSADGEGEGIPVAIFGGPHGDAPLEEGSGKLMADLVVDERLSMVLSLKHLGTRAAERRFALDFLERLYRRNSELVHLMIDEADLFAPQKPQAGDAPLLGVTENIVRRGRNSGIGITLITQRPAVLNKDVLTQVDALCVMRMLGPQDRNAIDDWVGEHGDTNLGKEVKESLPALATGECWWWVPEQGILKRTTVRASRTFDSSPTRKRGVAGREPRSYADVDMAAIEQKMAETIERAKDNDPRELRRRIAELERDLKKRPGETRPQEARVEERIVEKLVEVPALSGEQLAELRESLARVARLGVEISAALDTCEKTFSREAATIVSHLRTVTEGRHDGRPDTGGARPAPRRDRAEARRPEQAARRAPARPTAPPPAPADGGFEPSGPQRRILNALAALQTIGVEPVDKTQLALFAEASPRSSTYANNLGALRTGGLIDYPVPSRVALTDAGARLADASSAPTSTDELHAYVARLVGPTKWRLLQVLVAEGGDPVEKAELAERAGASATSSTYANNLGSLRTLGLLGYPSPGWVAAEPILFDP